MGNHVARMGPVSDIMTITHSCVCATQPQANITAFVVYMYMPSSADAAALDLWYNCRLTPPIILYHYITVWLHHINTCCTCCLIGKMLNQVLGLRFDVTSLQRFHVFVKCAKLWLCGCVEWSCVGLSGTVWLCVRYCWLHVISIR